MSVIQQAISTVIGRPKFHEILLDIQTEHPDMSAQDKERIISILRGASIIDDPNSFFYRLMRHHNADAVEHKYRITNRVLNYVKQNHPDRYNAAFQYAHKQILEYCLDNKENKIFPFVETFVYQYENVEDQDKLAYLERLINCFIACSKYANRSTQELEKSQKDAIERGGDVAYYDQVQKWPTYIIADSARQSLDYLNVFFNYCKKEMYSWCKTLESQGNPLPSGITIEGEPLAEFVENYDPKRQKELELTLKPFLLSSLIETVDSYDPSFGSKKPTKNTDEVIPSIVPMSLYDGFSSSDGRNVKFYHMSDGSIEKFDQEQELGVLPKSKPLNRKDIKKQYEQEQTTMALEKSKEAYIQPQSAVGEQQTPKNQDPLLFSPEKERARIKEAFSDRVKANAHAVRKQENTPKSELLFSNPVKATTKELNQDEIDRILKEDWEDTSTGTYAVSKQTTLKEAESFRELLKRAGMSTGDIQLIGNSRAMEATGSYNASKYQLEVSKKPLEEVLRTYKKTRTSVIRLERTTKLG